MLAFLRGNELLEEHKKTLISRMIWKITEANGKYNTRDISKKARKASKDERHTIMYGLEREWWSV